MLTWASYKVLKANVADVPENWIRSFAASHPYDCRKFASIRNGSMLYRVAAVLNAIEEGWGMPNGGIKEFKNEETVCTEESK